MIDDTTRRKLRELSLSALVDAIDLQDKDSSYVQLPFDERMKLAVDYLYEDKYVSTVKRLTSRASLRFPDADIGSMIYEGRHIDKALILQAATCQFASSATNIIIEGATGVGKSFCGCMLAKQCCKNRISSRYIRLPDLLMERDERSLVERSDMKLLRKYSNVGVLVIDEWLINDLDNEDIRFIFELVERRYSVHSTILCTQYPPDQWHARLGGGVQADAILDRLIQGSIRINLGTVNMRRLLSEA